MIVWDLASDTDPPRRHATIRFDAPVVSASFHPRNRSVHHIFYNNIAHILTYFRSKIVLILLGSGEAYIVDLRKEHRGRYELCEVLDESEDEAQAGRSRRVSTFPHGISRLRQVLAQYSQVCYDYSTLRPDRQACLRRHIWWFYSSIQRAHQICE